MYPNQFEYHRPSTVADAVQLLGNPDAKILAGGHSLIPAMKLRLASPGALVDLGAIAALKGITFHDRGVTIGAMTTYTELEINAELKEKLPIIAETATVIGDPMVRNCGTLGGALAHSDPAADYTAVMLALGAWVTVQGPDGERSFAVDELFVDLFTTSLATEEIITAIHIGADKFGSKQAYEKHAHPASGYAVVGVAAVSANGNTTIAITGAPSKATRASAAEAALAGQPLNAESVAAAAAVAAQGIEVNGDALYASEAYRTHLISVLTKRALTRVAGL